MLTELQPIAARLRAAERNCQRELGGSLVLRSVKFGLGLVLLGFLVDVFFHLEATPRVVILGSWAALVLAVGLRCGYLAWWQRHQLERIARLLESRDPALGSKLINVLQLEGVTADNSLGPLTRQLAQQAIAGYAADLQGVDFERLARTPRLRHELKKAVVAGLMFAAILCGFYRIAGVEIVRFADPRGDHPPYSVTRLEILEPGPQGAKVIYNKSRLVKVKYAGHKPGEVFLTHYPVGQPAKSTTVPMFEGAGHTFSQELDKIQTDLMLVAHTRNYHSYSQKRRIGVILTPKLEKAFVQIAPPAYTGLKPMENPFQFKNLHALIGSQIRFRLQSNRPLREGVIEWIKSERELQRIPMTLTATQEVAAAVQARDSARLRFSMVDAQGIPSEDAWEASLTLTYDLAPQVQITHPSKDSFVSIEFKLPAEIEATDDYGLRQLRLHVATNHVYAPPKLVEYTGIVRSSRETLPFDFHALGVRPGDTVSFFAEVIDTAPEPNLARSQTVNLMIISEADYNAFLRENSDMNDIEAKYADLLDQFHEKVEVQNELGDQIEALKRQAAGQKAVSPQEMDSLLARQNELNQQLNKLANYMDQFVRRDPVYDLERELQHLLSQKAAAIRSSTATNDSQNKLIANQSAPPAGPRQVTSGLLADFKKAADDQLARLAGVERETQDEVVDTLHDLSLMHEMVKDFNQFQALYQTQKGLSEQAAAYNRPGQLGRVDQLALKNLAAIERSVGEELDRLGAKLRSDAKAGDKLFPKAARSANDLAGKMDELRLSTLARQATGTMLTGAGEDSFNTSERLRSEMEKLFSECQAQGGQMGQEMDAYLRVQRGLNPRNSFAQMQQSRKFGQGVGRAFAQGQGAGPAGSSGYAAVSEPTLDVIGSEKFVERSNARAKASPAGLGKGAADPRSGGVLAEKPDVRQGLNPLNRPAEAVASEALIDEYRDLVDTYFKSITVKATSK